MARRPRYILDLIRLYRRCESVGNEPEPWHMTDKQVLDAMRGSSVLDDPPKDWTRRDLIMFCRGQLRGERKEHGNIASRLRVILHLAGVPRDRMRV